MKPMNFIVVEVLTLLYPLFLLTKNLFPLVMIIVIIEHGRRLYKNHELVNKDLKPNFIIALLYVLITILLFKTKQFALSGLLYGILQYMTYQYHEKQNKTKYDWIQAHIDIPITMMSSFISYYGHKTKNLYLAPFIGDLIYHVLEFITKSN